MRIQVLVEFDLPAEIEALITAEQRAFGSGAVEPPARQVSVLLGAIRESLRVRMQLRAVEATRFRIPPGDWRDRRAELG